MGEYRKPFVEASSLAIVDLVASKDGVRLEWSGEFADDDPDSPEFIPDRWIEGLGQGCTRKRLSDIVGLTAVELFEIEGVGPICLENIITRLHEHGWHCGCGHDVAPDERLVVGMIQRLPQLDLRDDRSTLSILASVTDREITGRSKRVASVPGEPAKLPIAALGLSEEARSCLRRASVRTVGQLAQRTADDLLDLRGFGLNSLKEVETKLDMLGLELGHMPESTTVPLPEQAEEEPDDVSPVSLPDTDVGFLPQNPAEWLARFVDDSAKTASLDADPQTGSHDGPPESQSAAKPDQRSEDSLSGRRDRRGEAAPLRSRSTRRELTTGATRTLPVGAAVLRVRDRGRGVTLVPVDGGGLDVLARDIDLIRQALGIDANSSGRKVVGADLELSVGPRTIGEGFGSLNFANTGADRDGILIAQLMDELGRWSGFSKCEFDMVDLDEQRQVRLIAEKHSLRLFASSSDRSIVFEVEGQSALDVIGISSELGGCLFVDAAEKRIRLYPSSANLQTADADVRLELLEILQERINQAIVGYGEIRGPYEGVSVSWRRHGQTDGEQRVEFPYMREAGEWVDRNRSDAAEMWLRWGRGRRMLIHRAETDGESTLSLDQPESIEPVTVYWQRRQRLQGRLQSKEFRNLAGAGRWIENLRFGREIIWLQWGNGRLFLVHWSAIDGDFSGEGA